MKGRILALAVLFTWGLLPGGAYAAANLEVQTTERMNLGADISSSDQVLDYQRAVPSARPGSAQPTTLVASPPAPPVDTNDFETTERWSTLVLVLGSLLLLALVGFFAIWLHHRRLESDSLTGLSE